jgi:hypothetical protein
MDKVLEDSLLHKALKEVESELDWGDSKAWSTQDFTDLSGKIFNKTGVVLSVTTLKRLWGKVNYKSKPTTGTLNVLVQFIGYENWQSYLQKQSQISKATSAVEKVSAEQTNAKRNVKTYLWPVIVAMFFIISTFLGFNFYLKPKKVSNGETKKSFLFTSKMMESEGVPNSIIFRYDATAAEPLDTVYIQQSWDQRLRTRVSRLEHTHKSIYYYPGFFQAKLIVNNKIVQEHPLYIKTKGWLPLIEQEGSPVYFKEKDALDTAGIFKLPIGKIEEKNIDLQPKTPWVSYFNIRKFDDLKTANFIFGAHVKSTYKEGAAACQDAEIHLLFEGGVFMIPLSIKGCVGGLMFYDASGKINDTSNLGCDLSEWVKIEFKVENKVGKLFINDSLAYDNLSLNIPQKKIVGIRFRFQGTGSVKNVNFAQLNGEVIYKDNFAKDF